jgi:hypothetical protein
MYWTLYYLFSFYLFFLNEKKIEEERSKWAEFCIAGVCPPKNLCWPPELARLYQAALVIDL